MDTLEALFSGQRQYHMPKGQILISPHLGPTGVYFIHAGYIKTYDISLQGEGQMVAIASPGDIIPLDWALDKEYRQLFYQSMTPVDISIMPKDEFKSAVNSSICILREVVTLLLKSYRYSQQRIQNLEYRSAIERIAFRLLFLGHYFGKQQGSTIKIILPLTYQDFADSLNITRDTANKALLALVKQGVISREKQLITLLDLSKLQSYIGEDTTLNI